MTTTKQQTAKKEIDLSKKVSIRQYVDPEVFNMGMEKYNMSVFSGETGSGGIYESLGYKELGDKKIYLTGLDTTADSVRSLPFDERERKEIEIEAALEHLGNVYGKETLDSKNSGFWSSHSLEIRVPILNLDLTDNSNLITYYNILGGGYSEIAPSFQIAKESNKIYKFYLHIDAEVSDIKTELTKLRNKSKAILEELDDEDFETMFKLAKLLLPIEKGLNRKTAKSLIYSELDAFINGDYSQNAKKEAPKKFLEFARKDKATLNLEAIVREALYHRLVEPNKDQMFWNPSTQVTYGRNENEIIAFLNNPINNDELLTIIDKVSKYWK